MSGGNWDELHQALGDAASMVRRGSALMISRGGSWIAEDLPLRGGGALGAVYVGVYEAVAQPGWLVVAIPATVGAWILAAMALSHGPEQDAEVALDVDELAVACLEIGSPHAHIQALADHLDATPDEVRECCTAAGIPVAPGVRMKGRGVSTGIKAADFPPLPADETEPLPEPVTSGSNSNNRVRKESREGMLIFYDETERRSHSLRKP